VHRDRSERDFHTRLGWWVMTHPRGGAALIGCVALLALAADGGYVAYRSHGLDTSFHRAFLVGVLGMWLLGVVVPGRLGVAEPLRADRAKARQRARRLVKLHAPIPIAVVAAGYAFGNHVMFGIVLGGFAFLFGLFVLSTLREIAHPDMTSSRTPRQASS
jgi:hypothetical protein